MENGPQELGIFTYNDLDSKNNEDKILTPWEPLPCGDYKEYVMNTGLNVLEEYKGYGELILSIRGIIRTVESYVEVTALNNKKYPIYFHPNLSEIRNSDWYVIPNNTFLVADHHITLTPINEKLTRVSIIECGKSSSYEPYVWNTSTCLLIGRDFGQNEETQDIVKAIKEIEENDTFGMPLNRYKLKPNSTYLSRTDTLLFSNDGKYQAKKYGGNPLYFELPDQTLYLRNESSLKVKDGPYIDILTEEAYNTNFKNKNNRK